MDLRYLRAGGTDPIEVLLPTSDRPPNPQGQPVREWIPQPDNPFRAKLWSDAGRSVLWVEGLGWYEIDTGDGRIVLPSDAAPIPREERLWGIPTSLCAIARGDQTLHAASVEVDGRAIVFGAPGRHGKTTLATAVHLAGYRLLSEDTTCCRPLAEPVAFPGPALLRVRRDSYERLRPHDVVAVGEDPDRVHLALANSRRGDGSPLPIGAIVLLREGERIRPDRVPPAAAIPELWALAFKMPTDEDRQRCFAAVTSLAATVPVWNLSRPLTYDSLPDVVAALAGIVEGRV